jgi:hypothetical protein
LAAKCGRINLKVRLSSFGAMPFSQLVILPNAILSTMGKKDISLPVVKLEMLTMHSKQTRFKSMSNIDI